MKFQNIMVYRLNVSNLAESVLTLIKYKSKNKYILDVQVLEDNSVKVWSTEQGKLFEEWLESNIGIIKENRHSIKVSIDAENIKNDYMKEVENYVDDFMEKPNADIDEVLLSFDY